MPRVARKKDPYAIYHIYQRGNNKQDLFKDDDDKHAFMIRLWRYVNRYKVKVLVYCLMTNHFHLNIESNGADISKVMQGLQLSYFHYFKKKYGYCNHLFQGRFGSEIIDTDRYMITASAYCHKNPVRAHMCKYPEEYRWSSMRVYLGYKDQYNIVHTDFILKMLDTIKSDAIKSYASIMERVEGLNIGEELDRLKYESSDKYYIRRRYDIEEVFKKVSEYFKTSMDEVRSKYSKRNTIKRQFAQYVLGMICNMSNKSISRYFNTSPSNIGQSIGRLMRKLKDDINLQYQLDNLCKCFE
jgi:REP element-mobilizing transposase RayT